MLGQERKALKHQKAQTTVESIILWKASVLQLDHSEGCDSTICHAPFFQGFKFFITAVDICYWLSHLWPVLPLSGLSSPEKHHLSWFIGHIRPETIFRTLHISPGCMCPTLISFQQILGWLKPWLNILALCDSWITRSLSKNLHRNHFRFPTIISSQLLHIYHSTFFYSFCLIHT